MMACIYLAISGDTAWGWGRSPFGALTMAELEAEAEGMPAPEILAWLDTLQVVEVMVDANAGLGLLLTCLELKQREAVAA